MQKGSQTRPFKKVTDALGRVQTSHISNAKQYLRKLLFDCRLCWHAYEMQGNIEYYSLYILDRGKMVTGRDVLSSLNMDFIRNLAANKGSEFGIVWLKLEFQSIISIIWNFDISSRYCNYTGALDDAFIHTARNEKTDKIKSSWGETSSPLNKYTRVYWGNNFKSNSIEREFSKFIHILLSIYNGERMLTRQGF